MQLAIRLWNIMLFICLYIAVGDTINKGDGGWVGSQHVCDCTK
jgi:hypothetical protein